MKLKPNPYTVKMTTQKGVVDLKNINSSTAAATTTTTTAPATSDADVDAKVKKFLSSVANVPDTLNHFKGLKWKQFRAMSKSQLITNGAKEDEANKIIKGFEKLDKKAASKRTDKDKKAARTDGDNK